MSRACRYAMPSATSAQVRKIASILRRPAAASAPASSKKNLARIASCANQAENSQKLTFKIAHGYLIVWANRWSLSQDINRRALAITLLDVGRFSPDFCPQKAAMKQSNIA